MTTPSPTSPDAARAAELLATADRLQRTVKDQASWRYVAWHVGMAASTALYFVGLGVLVEERAVLVFSAAYGLCVAALSIGLLAGVRVSKAGFPRRFVTSVVTWGLFFGVSLFTGLLLFPAALPFWAPAAVVTALPLVLGARAEAVA